MGDVLDFGNRPGRKPTGKVGKQRQGSDQDRAEPVELRTAPSAKTKSAKGRGNTLCRNNHHKWETVKSSQFDVKQGRLVTIQRCARCGKQRNRLT